MRMPVGHGRAVSQEAYCGDRPRMRSPSYLESVVTLMIESKIPWLRAGIMMWGRRVRLWSMLSHGALRAFLFVCEVCKSRLLSQLRTTKTPAIEMHNCFQMVSKPTESSLNHNSQWMLLTRLNKLCISIATHATYFLRGRSPDSPPN